MKFYANGAVAVIVIIVVCFACCLPLNKDGDFGVKIQPSTNDTFSANGNTSAIRWHDLQAATKQVVTNEACKVIYNDDGSTNTCNNVETEGE